ncbi:MAG: UxaA family hydrolase [Eubacteriaceae bacterium]
MIVKFKHDIIIIDNKDNVGTAVRDLANGKEAIAELPDGEKLKIVLLEDIPAYHKVSIKEIIKNENIIKYGFPIGKSAFRIQKGKHVHTHNITTNQGGF